MSCGRRLLLASAALVLANVLVLACEARHAPQPSAFAAVSAGLGAGSHAGIAGGFSAYDARLETLSDGAFEPLPGVRFQALPPGVFTPGAR